MPWQFPEQADDEGLRLVVAFLQITDPIVRQNLIAMAERAARNALPLTAEPLLLVQDNSPA